MILDLCSSWLLSEPKELRKREAKYLNPLNESSYLEINWVFFSISSYLKVLWTKVGGGAPNAIVTNSPPLILRQDDHVIQVTLLQKGHDIRVALVPLFNYSWPPLFSYFKGELHMGNVALKRISQVTGQQPLQDKDLAYICYFLSTGMRTRNASS